MAYQVEWVKAGGHSVWGTSRDPHGGRENQLGGRSSSDLHTRTLSVYTYTSHKTLLESKQLVLIIFKMDLLSKPCSFSTLYPTQGMSSSEYCQWQSVRDKLRWQQDRLPVFVRIQLCKWLVWYLPLHYST